MTGQQSAAHWRRVLVTEVHDAGGVSRSVIELPPDGGILPVETPAAAETTVEHARAACMRLLERVRPIIGEAKFMDLEIAINEIDMCIRLAAMAQFVAGAVSVSQLDPTAFVPPGHWLDDDAGGAEDEEER